MRNRSIYCLVVVTLLTVAGVGFTWNAGSAAGKSKAPVDGTAGNIAKWLSSTELGDSAIVEDSSEHVAIGMTPIPNAKFFVFSNQGLPNAAIVGNSSGTGRGVEGSSQDGIGVNGTGRVGVNAISSSVSTADSAVRGISQFPRGAYAGDFWGNVRVTGMLTKGGGSFRIDHPLDPKNKYLSHSFVESPDMMNIYNGNVVTNVQGEAEVELPSYFDALNRDFRYQLTVIGQFAQAMVLEKIKGNRFKIKTDKPNVEVSWQVTGIRKDKFAEDHRIKVESDKPESERGKLQNP